MASIVTLTFSPCIDKSTSVPELGSEKKLRCTAPYIEPGGGGINVARAIHRLGGRAIAVYPSGGYTGRALDALMAGEGVSTKAVRTINETRENFIVTETASKKQFRFTLPGVALKENELEDLMRALEELGHIQFIVVSGSLPPGLPGNLFSRLAAIAKQKNARLVVDTSGDALRQAVDAGVYLIKPNVSELALLVNKNDLQRDEIALEAKELIRQRKCEVIVISLGAGGAMLVTKDKISILTPPRVRVKSTVGAGDSMVAGLVLALSTASDIDTAFQYGVACGTAATLNAGTELCHKDDAEMLFLEMEGVPRQDIIMN